MNAFDMKKVFFCSDRDAGFYSVLREYSKRRLDWQRI